MAETLRLGPRWAARFPALAALAAHGVALALLALPALFLRAAASPAEQPWLWAITEGALAAFLGRTFGLPYWWLPLQFLFVPALILAAGLALDPVWYLAGFLLLALAYSGVIGTRVPLFLTSDAAVAALVELLPRKERFSFLDLGCGLAGVPLALARLRPNGRYEGVERAPLPFVTAWLRGLVRGGRVRVRFGSLWKVDYGAYDVVYAYLSPAPMEKLWELLRARMRPGSTFISNSFPVPGVAPEREIPVNDFTNSRLYVYRI